MQIPSRFSRNQDNSNRAFHTKRLEIRGADGRNPATKVNSTDVVLEKADNPRQEHGVAGGGALLNVYPSERVRDSERRTPSRKSDPITRPVHHLGHSWVPIAVRIAECNRRRPEMPFNSGN